MTSLPAENRLRCTVSSKTLFLLGFLSDIKQHVSEAINAVGTISLPQNNSPISADKPTSPPNPPVSNVPSTEKGPVSAVQKPHVYGDRPISTATGINEQNLLFQSTFLSESSTF